MPSGNAVAALALSRLARLTGEMRWREAADLQFAYLAGAVQRCPAGHGFALLAMLEELWPSAELVCAAETCPAALSDFLRGKPRPGLTVLVKTAAEAERLAALAPFTAGYPIPPQGARYYLCRGRTCASPVDTVEALEQLL